ncbi:MAG TPA: DEAD/DEAH box helicase, partial [Egibacteraceae bacterium]|nr:DEAD/DEAH box helicase [Egibacteraceae bacterium]
MSGSPAVPGDPGEPHAAFARAYGFALDDFQLAGISALAEDRSCLVAAPTGAGKTVVGEYAVWRALERGGKCFYTTPIKALSNQKFHDLTRRHGAERVGLLTGDNAVNGEAPVVVMTTEVLRNMLYEGSSTLTGLHAVVLDEVHYLADRERGAVWEEVIIQLPLSVQLACLSATVSNAEEFGAWLAGVRESCDVVISEFRPVPLEHHYAVNDAIYPVFRIGKKGGKAPSPERVAAAKQARAGTPNPEVLMLERRSGATGRPSRRGYRQHSGVRLRPPRRSEVAIELRRRRWLPAIYFLFSRAGCSDAVGQLVRDGVRLTNRAEADEIRAVVAERTADLPPEDLGVLGFAEWESALELGIAAHHAGIVPVFKETVEDLFVRGLVKICFATETLALGINMPARTVVVERLEKWNGQRHELLTPGQFTQLTGRAGRRGLDPVGHAVVLYQRDVDFPTVASLVGRRVEPLRSSFAPSYNMAVNLLRRHDRGEAEGLLARSFAQFQADGTVAGDEARLARNREALAGYAANLHSDAGNFAEYWALRKELSRLESAGAKERRRRQGDAVEEGIASLREGDVVVLPGGGHDPRVAAVVSRTTSRSGTPLVGAVTDDRKLVRLGPREFDSPPMKAGWVALPRAGGPRQTAYRKEVANQLRAVDPPASARSARSAPPDAAVEERIAELRDAIRQHPVHHDPQLPEIEVWARRYDELLAETERIEARVRRRTGSLVRNLDRIIGVLTDLGYLTEDPVDPRPTEEGMRLAGLYAETDLVLAESLRRGVFDGLDAPELAALASVFTHESRLKEPPPPSLPTVRVRGGFDRVVTIWEDVTAREEAASLPPTRPPDPAFADIVWRWA